MLRYRKLLAILAFFIVIAVIGWQFWPEDLFFPRLMPAATDSPVEILVGENVHVSKPHNNLAFTECIITAHPNRAKRLFASSLYWRHDDSTSIVGYLSDDGGTTWTTSLELVSDQVKKERLLDQTAVFGPDGDLYFVHMRLDDAKAGPESLGRQGAGALDWLCLAAGAATWESRGRIPLHIDRPWLAVDQTTGPNRGRGDLTGWHTAGLTADAAGHFHPVWIDDRNGKPQLWTATVTVR
jgi:hypothetical protein